ncbi:MAG: SDR family oxidoreductase [Halieaceae bacterium]|jgi:NAD(P)-dependent dehydrogenase (short-subunit alcohol dehydrogenase family)|nr:SDR family oxidoreductase [Halieaceae bacterium]
MTVLDNKVAVITGGTSGIGEAVARRFVTEGAQVVIAARGQERLYSLADEIGATPIICDISQFTDVENLAATVVDKFERIDIAVNSAGYEDACPIAELEPTRVEKMVAVQFTGALYFIQHMGNAMGKGGSVVSISSMTASIVAAGQAPYAGSKAGINHVSRMAASEYGGKGVRFNTVSPTLIETPMTAPMFEIPGMEEFVVQETPLGRVGRVEDVVEAVLWLSSDASGFVTGENINVCGGLGLRRLG